MQSASGTRLRIRRLLLAGNPYDAFLLEEAGFRPPEVEEPHEAPAFEPVRTGAEALRALGESRYDMLIADYSLPDMSGRELGARVAAQWPDVPTVLVTSNTDLGSVSELAPAAGPNLFIWFGSTSMLQALIRLHEDELNAPKLLDSGRSLLILLVEDEPNFYSHFVPLLYERLRATIGELVPAASRPNSIWSAIGPRPIVLLRRNFEGACEVLSRYSKRLIALITDMRFPAMGELKGDAGLRLLYRARTLSGHLPVAVHSREREHERAVGEAGGHFIWKDSPRLLYELDHFLCSNCGFGPFEFRWPAGETYGVAHNLRELRDLVADVPDVVFEHHGLHSDFSTWLAVHGYQELARTVRDLSIAEPDPRRRTLALLDQELDKTPLPVLPEEAEELG
jgi:CheY-like chemotaxis protein